MQRSNMNFQQISLTVTPTLPYVTSRRGSRIHASILPSPVCVNPRQSPTHCGQCLLLSDLENEPLRLAGTVLISIKECYHTHLVREGGQSHWGEIFDPTVFSLNEGRVSLLGWYRKCHKGQ